MTEKKQKLTFEEAIEKLNNEWCIKSSEVQTSALRRKIWVAEWHFFGCLSESQTFCRTKAEAIEAALFFADDGFGFPRGMRTALKRDGVWSGPVYGSSGDVQRTAIHKTTLGDLL